MKKIFLFLIVLVIFSCKKEKVSNVANHFELKQEQQTNSRQKKVVEFYNKLLVDNFVSTKDFIHIFGNLYNEAENFFKKNNSADNCFEISDTCKSYIFNIMKENSNNVSFGYTFKEIQNFIESTSKKSENSIEVRLEENKVLFYFKENIITNIIINDEESFLAEFEE